MAFFLLVVAVAAIAWGVIQTSAVAAAETKLKKAELKLKVYSDKYQPAIDVDEYVRQGEERVQALLGQQAKIQAEIESAEGGCDG